MRPLPRLAARIFNTPLMVAPWKLDQVITGLGPRFGVVADELGSGLYSVVEAEKRQPGYRVTAGGVAVIDVFGVLVHRGRMEADSSYLLGYQDIAFRLADAVKDPSVAAIVLQIDSPGGEVSGAFELASAIAAARAIKPVEAVASDLMASAAYLIGSAARSISVSSTSMIGSIGVVMRHVNMRKMLAKEGVAIEQLYAGARKIDGHPYGPLTDEARGRFQAEVDRVYGLFVDAVAANRSIGREAVIATEAGIFSGQDTITGHLADRIETPDQMIARLETDAAKKNTKPSLATARTTRKLRMNDETTNIEAAISPAISEDDLKHQYAKGHADGLTAGTAAERSRISGILTCPEAAGREGMAMTLALESDITPALASKLLLAAPKATTTANVFADAMLAIGNPRVGPDIDEPDSEKAAIARILNS